MNLTKENIQNICEEFFKENIDIFLVEMKISPKNDIYVRIDGDKGVTIEKCAELSRKIDGNFDREEIDLSIEVSSYDIMAPLILERQYKKNEGRNVKIITTEGKEYEGLLKEYRLEVKEFYLEIKSKKQKLETIVKLENIKTINIKLKF